MAQGNEEGSDNSDLENDQDYTKLFDPALIPSGPETPKLGRPDLSGIENEQKLQLDTRSTAEGLPVINISTSATVKINPETPTEILEASTPTNLDSIPSNLWNEVTGKPKK